MNIYIGLQQQRKLLLNVYSISKHLNFAKKNEFFHKLFFLSVYISKRVISNKLMKPKRFFDFIYKFM